MRRLQSVLLQFALCLALITAAMPPARSVQANRGLAPLMGWNGSAYVGLRAPFPYADKMTVTGDKVTHGGGTRHAVDIGMASEPVLAMHAGKVMAWKPNNGAAGNELDIDHGDGYCSAYLHLGRAFITTKGLTVGQGDLIALSGNTGNGVYHLHVEVNRIANGQCNINQSPEVPMFFNEFPGRELRKGDVLTSSQPQRWANGRNYAISNTSTKLFIDVNGAKTTNETKIIQWEATGQANQIWRVEGNPNGYYRLISTLSNAQTGKLCLVVQYASTANGAKAILNKCSPSGQNNEWWRPLKQNNRYFLQNKSSKKVLVVPSGSGVWGTQLIIWSPDAGAGQTWQWTLKP